MERRLIKSAPNQGATTANESSEDTNDSFASLSSTQRRYLSLTRFQLPSQHHSSHVIIQDNVETQSASHSTAYDYANLAEDNADDYEDIPDGYSSIEYDYQGGTPANNDDTDDEDLSDDYEDRWDDYEHRLNDYEHRLDDFEDRCYDYGHRLNDYEHRLNDYEDLRDIYEDLRDVYEVLRDDYEDLRDDYEDLRDDYEDVRDDYEDPRDDYEDPRDDYEVIRDDYEDHWDDYEDHWDDYEDFSDDYEEHIDVSAYYEEGAFPFQEFGHGNEVNSIHSEDVNGGIVADDIADNMDVIPVVVGRFQPALVSESEVNIGDETEEGESGSINFEEENVNSNFGIGHNASRLPTGEIESDVVQGVKRKAEVTQEGPSSKIVRRTFECPVCKMDLEGRKVVAPSCGHTMCHTCMQRILNLQKKCPICRAKIRPCSVRNIYL